MEQIDIVAQIRNKLAEIEHTKNVRVIMAIESGSRAWGFASPDSDYDVRFIYVRKPEDYIKLSPPRDVIEWQLDDVYDISGWDLQKALRLMHASNPTLQEWCNSPIVYKENDLAAPFRALADEFFMQKKALYHYYSMARMAYNKYLAEDQVRIKKYFYVLRPLLAAKWVAERGTPPPMLFDDLVSTELDPAMLPAVEELLRIKKETPELGTGPRIPELNDYLVEQMELVKEEADKAEPRRNEWDKLEAFFLSAVMGGAEAYEEV